MNNKIEFKDIDGVQIHEGDEILITHGHYSGSASVLRRGKVIRFTSKTCFYEIKGNCHYHEGKMLYDQTNLRVLVLKGELVEYSKTKDLTND